MWRSSIFSNDTIMIFYFSFFIFFFTKPTFSRNFKFLSLLAITMDLLNYFSIILEQYSLLPSINNIFSRSKFYMVSYIDRHYVLICSHNYKQCNFDIFQCLDQNRYYQLKVIKDTHRKKEPSNKTPTLTKSRNMGIWIVGTINQLFMRGSKTETRFSKK